MKKFLEFFGEPCEGHLKFAGDFLDTVSVSVSFLFLLEKVGSVSGRKNHVMLAVCCILPRI